MSIVEFHHGMSDKLAYTCRLLRKAYRSGARVVVTGDAASLRALDRQLWVFDDRDFVPHALALSDNAVPVRQHDTPIWLTTDPASAPGERGVLVNIGQTMPPACERFARLFEVISNETIDRQQGRARWKSYAAKGWQVNPHEVKE